MGKVPRGTGLDPEEFPQWSIPFHKPRGEPRIPLRSSSNFRLLPHSAAVPPHLLPKGAWEAAAASTPTARRQGKHSETARSRQAPQGLQLSVQLRPRSQLRRLLGRDPHQQHGKNPLHGPGTAGAGSTSGPWLGSHLGPGVPSGRGARIRHGPAQWFGPCDSHVNGEAVLRQSFS